MRAVDAVVLGLLAATMTACEADRPPDPARSASETSPSAGQGSVSDEIGSDVQVQMFRVGSRDELVQRLGDLGWEEIIVFPERPSGECRDLGRR